MTSHTRYHSSPPGSEPSSSLTRSGRVHSRPLATPQLFPLSESLPENSDANLRQLEQQITQLKSVCEYLQHRVETMENQLGITPPPAPMPPEQEIEENEQTVDGEHDRSKKSALPKKLLAALERVSSEGGKSKGEQKQAKTSRRFSLRNIIHKSKVKGDTPNTVVEKDGKESKDKSARRRRSSNKSSKTPDDTTTAKQSRDEKETAKLKEEQKKENQETDPKADNKVDNKEDKDVQEVLPVGKDENGNPQSSTTTSSSQIAMQERKRPALQNVRRATVTRRRPSVRRASSADLSKSLEKLDTIEKKESLSNVTHDIVEQTKTTSDNKIEESEQQQQSGTDKTASRPSSPSTSQHEAPATSKPKRRMSYHQGSNSFGDMMNNSSELLAKLKKHQVD